MVPDLSVPGAEEGLVCETSLFDQHRLAAILYRPDDDVDSALAGFAFGLAKAGLRIGGLVQRNIKDATGRKIGMQVIDLETGRAIPISQSLGGGSGSCMLDPSGLAEASRAIARAIDNRVALVIINKFSKQESSGCGLRDEIAAAVAAGLPLLTAVPESSLAAWAAFTGGRVTMLHCAREALDEWWAAANRGQACVD